MAKEVTVIEKICPYCVTRHEVRVTTDKYNEWKSGMLIQVAFPELEPEERELLISGICGKCWNEMFKDEDESE